MNISDFFGKLLGNKASKFEDFQEQHSVLIELLLLIREEANDAVGNYYDLKLNNSEEYGKIKKLTAAERRKLVFEVVNFLIAARKFDQANVTEDERQLLYQVKRIGEPLLQALLRQKLDFSDLEVKDLFTLFRESSHRNTYLGYWPVGLALMHLEKWVKKYGLSSEIRAFLQEMMKWREIKDDRTYGYGPDWSKLRGKILKMLGDEEQQVIEFKFGNDAFGSHANDTLYRLKEGPFRNTVHHLLDLCSKVNGGKPTQRFLKQTKALLDTLDTKAYKEMVWDWLAHLVQMKNTAEDRSTVFYDYTQWSFLDRYNAMTLKGLVWTMVNFHDAKSLELLAKAAERCFQKVPGVGPASGALGNACIYVLAQSKGLLGISHLSRLKLKIRQANTRSLIQKYINSESERRNISPAEIEEIAVPDFKLQVGQKRIAFDDYWAEVRIEGIGKVRLQWIKPDGKTQKSVPGFIKKSAKHKERLKKLRAEVKQIKTYLTTQRDRIDRSFIEERSWTYAKLKEYYLNHGLVSFIARQLIWRLQKEDQHIAALYLDGQWQDLDGQDLDWVSEATSVSLWHPIYATVQEVQAWRLRLESLQIQQALKQAYRELYLLTDAEVNTRQYSNRMAAHILKQYQLNSLASIRGWKYALMGAYDDGRDMSVASRELAWANLRAEFWITEIYDDEAMADSGIWLYVSTDQVRFVRNDQVLDLVDLPKMIFSEVMRDVDLFVGVASVGNDPQWQDNGGLPQHRDYWTTYSFGELSTVAQTRKEVLERLVPRLKIKEVARIDGRFLRVKGKLREYKIHLGSTNILMEPNDQYLCIVPSRKNSTSQTQVFLPFEGDNGLSVIISKALMLADDDKIKDPTILSQLKTGFL
ncbi:MAG: DUF4132 domain-containing protein [Bacteroidota bacterium]